MSKPYNPLSRRNWLGQISAVSIGSGVLAASANAQTAADPMLGARIYNIRDFGAKGDGATLDTAALQTAIDKCSADQGGTVLVPAGVFVIGTVQLKSNVTLHIAVQGKLLGSADGKQYHASTIPLSGDSTLNDGNVGLLYAENAENITVEGPGTIDGQGAQFRSPSQGVPSPAGISGAHRPYHLLFYKCKNVIVRNIFLVASAFHSVRIISSSYVYLDAIHIYNRSIHNSDGFHFISSEYVHLTNCDLQTQDDACALFGSCKFVTVTNCSFSTRWSVFRFGGGEAENITVSNCLIYDTYGCPIKMRCSPGARFENISFSNIVMKNVTGPISIGLGPQRRNANNTGPNASEEAGTAASEDEQGKYGIVRNISFQNIRATVVVPVRLPDVNFGGAYNPGEIKSCIAVNSGGEGIIKEITFSDVHVTFAGGGTAEEGANRDVPKTIGEYYAGGVLPAYGLYARGVRGLTLQNVRFEFSAPELRPAVVFDHVEDAIFNGFSAQGNKDAASLMRFTESRDVLISATRALTPTPVFLEVEGAATSGIVLDGGDISKATTPLSQKADVPANAVKVRA